MKRKINSLILPFTAFTLFIFFILIMGCTSCTLSENKNIIATKDVSRKIENYGLTVHYNITISIKNTGINLAKSSIINTYYCNEYPEINHNCYNQTFSLGDLNPNETVQRFFEYDIDAIRDVTLGTYSLQYQSISC